MSGEQSPGFGRRAFLVTGSTVAGGVWLTGCAGAPEAPGPAREAVSSSGANAAVAGGAPSYLRREGDPLTRTHAWVGEDSQRRLTLVVGEPGRATLRVETPHDRPQTFAAPAIARGHADRAVRRAFGEQILREVHRLARG